MPTGGEQNIATDFGRDPWLDVRQAIFNAAVHHLGNNKVAWTLVAELMDSFRHQFTVQHVRIPE